MAGKLLTEMLGTFFLMLTIGLTVLGGVEAAPLAIGSVLMVMVYMGGHVSGAHYNPAVTVAVLLRGKIGSGAAGLYVVAQLVGAALASAVTMALMGQALVPAPGATASATQIVLVEVLFTFALCLVVLHVATSRRTEGNSFYGLAIGFTVMVGAFAGGGISGGAFNPAVGLGPALVAALTGAGFPTASLHYLVGPLLGAVLAVAAFRVQLPEEFSPASLPFPAGLRQTEEVGSPPSRV